MQPFIIVNFKTYKETTGAKAIKLAKVCEKVARKTKKQIIIAVQALDLAAVSKAVKIPVYAQHVDDAEFGSHTGKIQTGAVKLHGATGTLLNHSENQIPISYLKSCAAKAKDAKLTTCVCAKDASVAKKLLACKPDFIAIEPPELIGGTVSVSEAKPDLIRRGYNVVKHTKTKLIVGAGVNCYQDVATSRGLGAIGVLVASAVTKSRNPEKVLTELVRGL